FDFSGASGSFALNLPSLGGGLNWDSSALLTTGELKVVSASTNNADFNSDGIVDGTDFLTWQQGLGLTGQTGKTNGNANNDTVIDGLDLAVWQSKFGGPGASATSGAVPE